MLCFACHCNEATYNVDIIVNNEKVFTLFLCHDCYVFFQHRTSSLYDMFG